MRAECINQQTGCCSSMKTGPELQKRQSSLNLSVADWFNCMFVHLCITASVSTSPYIANDHTSVITK